MKRKIHGKEEMAAAVTSKWMYLRRVLGGIAPVCKAGYGRKAPGGGLDSNRNR